MASCFKRNRGWTDSALDEDDDGDLHVIDEEDNDEDADADAADKCTVHGQP